MNPKLVELNNRIAAINEKQGEVWALAGADNDFERKEVLELLNARDSTEAVEKYRALEAEVAELQDQARPLAEVESLRQAQETRSRALEARGRPSSEPTHPDPRGPAATATLGAQLVAAEGYRDFLEANARGRVDFELNDWGLRELRATLLESTTGIPVENVRSGRLVEATTRPIQVLDIIPGGQTGGNAYVYMEETLRTHSGAEMREGAAYPEDAYKWTERSEPVRKVGTKLPVTDEQFEDVPGIESYVNSRMTFGLRQRYDTQVVSGDGVPPNVEGILNRPGIQTQAKGTDPVPDAIRKAITLCRVTGRAMPNYVLLHPNDWQEIRLLRTADGIYIWGSPSEAGPARIWGLPVVEAEALTEGTGLVGDFMFCQSLERRGVDVQVGYVDAQFGEGKRTIRADLRIAFAVYRPPAFCTVTGI